MAKPLEEIELELLAKARASRGVQTDLVVWSPGEVQAVIAPPKFFTDRESALEKAALIGAVKDANQQELAVEALRVIKGLLSDMEKRRERAKAPVLDLGRAIDATAKQAVEELKAEELRLNTELGSYQQEQLIIARRKEAERQAELNRIEDERKAKEREAWLKSESERKAREEAERAAQAKAAAEERARQEAIAKAAAEKARLEREAQAQVEAASKLKGKKAAEEKARLESERAEAMRKADEESARLKAESDAARKAEADRAAQAEAARVDAEEKLRLEEQAIAERAGQAQEMLGGPIVPTTAAGQSSKPAYDFEVVDVWKLTRANPGFVDPKPRRADILAAINEHGVKEIAGLRIFEVVKTRISKYEPRAIEV